MIAECFECNNIIDGTGGFRCMLITNRKYIAGFFIGAVLVYVLSGRR